MVKKAAVAIFKLFCSLKFAVVVMTGLTLGLIAATFLESIYDTPTAQYLVYRSWWFYTLLVLLAVLIFAVAMSRYPWKKRHGPFLMAHLGIEILLFGSLLTYRFGLDGNLRVSEGDRSNIVELQDLQLQLLEGDASRVIDIPWIPPTRKFKPIELPDLKLRIDQFLTHADPVFDFKPSEEKSAPPAVKIQLVGGPMRIKQDYWLWLGDPSWSSTQAGPARLMLGPESSQRMPVAVGQPVLQLLPGPDGSLAYEARSSTGELRKGKFAAGKVQGQVIEPGWKGGVTVSILEWIPAATHLVTYRPSEVQYGQSAPPSAIHVVAGSGSQSAEIWLGLGDRAMLNAGGRQIALAYRPEHQRVPFEIQLERFILEHYEGTRDPARYSSIVRVVENGKPGEPIEITMNEPLHHQGITFYQASYEDAQPRPVTTILSVNRDPGRPYKYWGSLLIVLGSIWLFAVKTRKKGNTS